MKRLIIVCEGQTEQEFVNEILAPYLSKYYMAISGVLIKSTGGGIGKWTDLKKQIENHLRESNCIVTTFIDYYGIPKSANYPAWEAGESINNTNDKLLFLEQNMLDNIDNTLNKNFIPYYQLHEFEALLFINLEAFQRSFEPKEIKDIKTLIKLLEDYPNPELINNSPNTAPSKRMLHLIDGYEKALTGIYLALNIGLDNMLAKCPKFKTWIEQLIKYASL